VSGGLEFRGDFSSGINSNFDSLVGFRVVSPNPIKTVNLEFDGTSSGQAMAHVSETILPDGKTPLNEGLSVFSTANSTDSLSLGDGLNSFYVQKDIAANSGGGSATISFVRNTFDDGSGQPPVIPEPATLALIPLALTGLALRKKLGR